MRLYGHQVDLEQGDRRCYKGHYGDVDAAVEAPEARILDGHILLEVNGGHLHV